ncbi:MAG: hypothetical protein M1840_003203 [Geoglossum simile]|nr:MAG: hypothetical protein M1840_003203 [Geoglossum simile]
MSTAASTLIRNVATRPTAPTSAAVQAMKFAARSREVSTTTAMFGLKESARDNETHYVEVERHKQDILREQKEGKAHWKEALASDSESAIKADRDEVEPQAEVVIKLQGVGGGDGGMKKEKVVDADATKTGTGEQRG